MIRATAVTTVLIFAAVGLASPAWADERLDGEYTFINGPTIEHLEHHDAVQPGSHVWRDDLDVHRVDRADFPDDRRPVDRRTS